MSNVDVSGIRHTVEVSADSLYETAVLAVRTFQQHDRAPDDMNALEVEIRSSVTHTLTLKKSKRVGKRRCTNAQGSCFEGSSSWDAVNSFLVDQDALSLTKTYGEEAERG